MKHLVIRPPKKATIRPQSTTSVCPSDIDKLFNKSNLELFFQKLLSERHYKPTTIAEKIRRMKLAIKYVIHTEDSMLTNKELYFKGNRLLEILTQWCLSLSKAIALQRQQHSLTVTEHLPLLLDPQEFLDNDQEYCTIVINQLINLFLMQVQNKVKDARKILNTEKFDAAAGKILTAYVAACHSIWKWATVWSDHKPENCRIQSAKTLRL